MSEERIERHEVNLPETDCGIAGCDQRGTLSSGKFVSRHVAVL